MSHATAKASLKRLLVVKFLAGLLMGLIVEALLLPIHDLGPVRTLRYLGEDVVFNAVARSGPTSPPGQRRYVFVNVDDASLRSWGKAPGTDIRPEIKRLLTTLRQSRAAVVVVDILFSPRATEANPLFDVMAGAGRPLIAVAQIQAPDLSMPLSMPRLGPDYRDLARAKLAGLTLATPDLDLTEDGKARERVTAYCVDDGAREVALPGIAEAVRDALGQAKPAPHDCNKLGKERTKIIFVQPYAPPHAAPFAGLLSELSASNVTRDSDEVADAVVVVGQSHAGTSDWFATPLGWMPGVFVHLNSIMSDQMLGGAQEATFLQEFGLLLLIIVTVTTTYLLYWAAHERWIEERPLEPTWRGLLYFALDLGLFLAVTAVALAAVFAIVRWEGTDLLLRGVIVGTLVPAMAVVLEAAFELGKPTMFWLEELAERLVRSGQGLWRRMRGGGTVVALMVGALAAAASAAELPVARLQPDHGSSMNDFTIEHHDASGSASIGNPDAAGALVSGDVVRAIRRDASASIVSTSTRQVIARVTNDNPVKLGPETAAEPSSSPFLRTVPGASEASVMPHGPMPTAPTSVAPPGYGSFMRGMTGGSMGSSATGAR